MARHKYITDEERRAAAKERQKRYRERHPEKVKATQRASQAKRKDKIRAYKKQPHIAAKLRDQQRLRRLSRDKPTLVAARNRRNAAKRAATEPDNPRNSAWLLGRPQPEVCDACGGNDGGIVFDHCHNKGHARGWLCNRCNVALGCVKDDINRLRQLIAYLERTKNGVGAQSSLPGI